MKTYCATKDYLTVIGTPQKIVEKVAPILFDEQGRLTVYVKGYTPTVYQGYNMDEFTVSERYADAIQFVFRKLKGCGFRIFEEIQ